MWYSLLFQRKNGCTNAPQYFVILYLFCSNSFPIDDTVKVELKLSLLWAKPSAKWVMSWNNECYCNKWTPLSDHQAPRFRISGGLNREPIYWPHLSSNLNPTYSLQVSVNIQLVACDHSTLLLGEIAFRYWWSTSGSPECFSQQRIFLRNTTRTLDLVLRRALNL